MDVPPPDPATAAKAIEQRLSGPAPAPPVTEHVDQDKEEKLPASATKKFVPGHVATAVSAAMNRKTTIEMQD